MKMSHSIVHHSENKYDAVIHFPPGIKGNRNMDDVKQSDLNRINNVCHFASLYLPVPFHAAKDTQM